MKIKERIEIMLNKAKVSENVVIHVFDNTVEYSPLNEWFYLSDYSEFKDLPILNKELDTEAQCISNKVKTVSLGFNGLKKVSNAGRS